MKARDINILIACEESQVECMAFRERGFNAYSCDLQECSGGHPGWHIVGDVRSLFQTPCAFVTQQGTMRSVDKWHLIIAHPPCTYLSKVSASNSIGGIMNDPDRLRLGYRARRFFYECLNAPAPFVAIENPVPLRVFDLPRPTTRVDPFEFGEPWSKCTCLWLRNLPPLFPTIYASRWRSWVYSTRGGKKRSKSFRGIAAAMADQ